MNEGVFRILRALGDGRPRAIDVLARDAGEAPSVVKDLLRRKAKWFIQEDGALRCTDSGLAALARELVARTTPPLQGSAELDAIRASTTGRGPAKRELDQVYATADTVLSRAQRLVRAGEAQRGLLFLGDDDLTSIAVHLLGVERKITVVDIDEDLLGLMRTQAEARGWQHDGVHHDLRDPLPPAMRGRFGCVFTDPPYAPEGFELFVSRAVEALKPDGRLYICFGWSRRASERGLAKQRILTDAGLMLEEALPDFNVYEGAESIGSRSGLWVLTATPKMRPKVRGRDERELYTRRSPKRRKGSS